MLKIADALKDPDFASEVPIDVDFYFKSQPLPKAGTALGDVEVRLKRRRSDYTDEKNCHMAFVAVLNELREKAIAAGGNSVSNLVSYYKQQPSGSETDFQCNAGATGGIVWLKGTIRKCRADRAALCARLELSVAASSGACQAREQHVYLTA